MSNKEIIKNYLEDCAKTDKALAEKFDASKMDACMKFIENQVLETIDKKDRHGTVNRMVAPEVVYKWARDFFIDGAAAAAQKDKPEESKGISEDEMNKAIEKAKAEAVDAYKAEEKAKAQAKAEEKAAAKEAKKAAENQAKENELTLF